MFFHFFCSTSSRMPKLKKRRNVPSQRKPKKKPNQNEFKVADTITHDHTYFTTLPVVADIAESLLEEKPDLNMIIEEPDISTTSIDLDVPIESVIDREETVIKAPAENTTMSFQELKNQLPKYLDSSYLFSQTSEIIQICQMYPSTETVTVKLNVNIDMNFKAKIYIHRLELSLEHRFWTGLPSIYDSVSNVKALLMKLENYYICTGNFDKDLIDTIPIGSAVTQAKPNSLNSQAFRECDFGAVRGTISYSSTVRNINCQLLVQGQRCSPCSQLRRVLVARKYRQEEKSSKQLSTPDYTRYKKQHTNMSRQELITKIKQQKDIISSLETEISRTRLQFQREMSSKGVTLDLCQSLELKDTMSTCTAEVE